MQWLHWGWDAFWLHPVERIRDATTIVLGALSAYLAYRAIRMGKEQAATSKRQAEIAEKQDRLLETQLGLRVQLSMRPAEENVMHPRITVIPMEVLNMGDKVCNGCYWECFIETLSPHVWICDIDGERVESQRGVIITGVASGEIEYRELFSGHSAATLFPDSVATAMQIKVIVKTVSSFDVYWRLSHEDGGFPEAREKFAGIRFDRNTDDMFDVGLLPSIIARRAKQAPRPLLGVENPPVDKKDIEA